MYILMYKREEIAFMHIIKSFHFFVFWPHAYFFTVVGGFKHCFCLFGSSLVLVVVVVVVVVVSSSSCFLCQCMVVRVSLSLSFCVFARAVRTHERVAVSMFFLLARTNVLLLNQVLQNTAMAIITFLFIHMSSTVHFTCRMCLLCETLKIKYVFKFSSNERKC